MLLFLIVVLAMKKNNKEKILQLYNDINDFSKLSNYNRLDIYAACAAFYIFMSFIPFLTILLALVPYLPVAQRDVDTVIMTVLPKEYDDLVELLLNNLFLNNSVALPVSILGTIWASARGIMGITKGLNQILSINEYRNFVYMRIRSAFYTLFLWLAVILLLILTVFGDYIRSIIGRYVIVPDFVDDILAFRNLAMLVMLFLLFVFLFVALPAKKMKIKQQLPGAFLASLVWWLFTRLFSFYLSTYDSYSIYGGFAIIVIISVWLYTGMLIMFMGAQLNVVLSSRKGIINERQN